MTIETLRDHLYRVVDIELAGSAPDYIRASAVRCLNQAFQTIWLSPNSDFLTREENIFTTAAGTASYKLNDNVQDVLGPLTFVATGKPIAPCDSKGEFLSFGPIYSGDNYSIDQSDPEVFYVDRLRKTGDADDEIVEIYLRLAPTPDGVYNLSVDVAKECPVFTESSFCDGTKLPIPHKYHESILLPIAEYYMTKDARFSRMETLPEYEKAFSAAMAALGVSDPQIYSADSKSRREAARPKE